MGASPRSAGLRGITGGLPRAPIGRRAPQVLARQAPVGAAVVVSAAGAGGAASQPLPE
jgi:hypothetical protein